MPCRHIATYPGSIQQDDTRAKFIQDKYLEMAYTRPEKKEEIIAESELHGIMYLLSSCVFVHAGQQRRVRSLQNAAAAAVIPPSK